MTSSASGGLGAIYDIVYNGVNERNDVVFEQMKEVGGSDDSTVEFLKEVAVLDKFRCDYIVHFYGGCAVLNHVMMVTEYQPCGSVMDCINNRPEPEDIIKTKVMLDAAKGLENLHGSGILHRVIKPDNIIVFALDEVIYVNGKLTDSGRSRNINLFMTNLTFTRGLSRRRTWCLRC